MYINSRIKCWSFSIYGEARTVPGLEAAIDCRQFQHCIDNVAEMISLIIYEQYWQCMLSTYLKPVSGVMEEYDMNK